MEEDNSVIILSDEEEECSVSSNNDSVLIIETPKNRAVWERPKSLGVLEEDLVITFSRQAEVLPHARYDCSTHTFTPTDGETGAPVGSNQLICDQCYCYVCDKPANQCAVWSVSGRCHCNAHKRSEFWRSSRDKVVLGYLHCFHLDLLEIDSDLRLAESLLLTFEAELSAKYASFLRGLAVACSCNCHTANSRAPACQGCQSKHFMVYDYAQVYECVQSFLNRAHREKPKAAAVMRLGAAHFFISHCRPPGLAGKVNVEDAKFLLLQRVADAVQTQLVLCDFGSDFTQKLQSFYQSLPFPPRCAALSHSLAVRPWKDPLLVSVLRGQNVSGVRQGKRVKDSLVESAVVMLLRVQTLERQHRYRELIRYLRVVQTTNGQHVSEVRDLVPFYQCKDGDFCGAVSSFFAVQERRSSACRLTPRLFVLYLRIFSTATAPTTPAGMATLFAVPKDHWEPIAGVSVMRSAEIVRFSLRVLKCNKAVNTDSQCWAYLLHIVNAPSSDTHIPDPSPVFLQGAVGVATEILLSPSIQIPRSYLNVCPDQALLLLVTEALAQRIMDFPLSPALPVLIKYEVNVWCLRWLFQRVSSSSSSPELLRTFLGGVAWELHQSPAQRISAPALRCLSVISDHSYAYQSQPRLSDPEAPPLKKQHSDHTLNEHSDQMLNEHSDHTLNEHSDQMLNERSDHTLNEHSDQMLNERSDQRLNEHSDQRLNEHSDQRLNEHSDQRLNEHSDHTLNEHSDHPLNERSVQMLNERSVQMLNERSVQMLNERSDHTLNEHSDQTVNEPASFNATKLVSDRRRVMKMTVALLLEHPQGNRSPERKRCASSRGDSRPQSSATPLPAPLHLPLPMPLPPPQRQNPPLLDAQDQGASHTPVSDTHSASEPSPGSLQGSSSSEPALSLAAGGSRLPPLTDSSDGSSTQRTLGPSGDGSSTRRILRPRPTRTQRETQKTAGFRRGAGRASRAVF